MPGFKTFTRRVRKAKRIKGYAESIKPVWRLDFEIKICSIKKPPQRYTQYVITDALIRCLLWMLVTLRVKIQIILHHRTAMRQERRTLMTMVILLAEQIYDWRVSRRFSSLLWMSYSILPVSISPFSETAPAKTQGNDNDRKGQPPIRECNTYFQVYCSTLKEQKDRRGPEADLYAPLR